MGLLANAGKGVLSSNKIEKSEIQSKASKINWENLSKSTLYPHEIEVYTICGPHVTITVTTSSAVLTETEFHIAANWVDMFTCGYSYWYIP
jgi:hypothetical protein